ncbi:hypothetical protein NLU13_2615 [Sarocladium strictum]|uniref:C6 transcription factor n=1 Tax=Sarocladium strictum TaxID=5046 RepID=A0AA39GLB8_SARSR|nr:hypothetical protein NLU13_2615 [Sarocladium strictum]
MVTTRSSTTTDGVSPTSPRAVANGHSSSSGGWKHAPTNWTLGWLVFSLPLVTWDFIYCLFRPWTMPGGAWHWPLWTPYELYGTVDYVYGWPAFNENNGFTSAQAVLNVIETIAYVYYLRVYLTDGKPAKGASPSSWTGKSIEGSAAGKAALVGFAAAVMTLSKTVLYWLNEYYSNYRNIGHNSLQDLLFLWIIPNGAWLVGSGYMTISIGNDILRGLSLATSRSKRD